MRIWIFGLFGMFCIIFSVQAAELEITELTPDTYEVVELSTIFEDGGKYYVDREYIMTVVPDEIVEEIGEAEAFWIKTGNDNKANADEVHISFETNVNLWVYVAYDRRAAVPPAWVIDGFEDMEVDLATTDIPLGIWKSIEEMPAGLVELPGNNFGGAAGANSNYAAFVVMGSLQAVEASGKLATTWGQLKE